MVIGMQLSGSGANDPRWLEKFLKHPPTNLSTLEYWVGSIDVDWRNGEGLGYLFRPHEGRGRLRDAVTRLSATFRHDRYHEDHARPRDMTLTSVTLVLDVGHASVAQRLQQLHGPGREIAREHGPVVEYGAWFYLGVAHDASAVLSYEVVQPEWAIPAAPRGAHETLLHTLHDRLICDTDIDPILAALKDPARAAGAELRDWNRHVGQIELSFRPALPLADVLTALRWENPVASSGDVHMSTWRVEPHRPDAPHRAPHINGWRVDVRLDGWPRGANGARLPEVGRAGPSPLYDVRACVNKVAGIAIRRERT